MIITLEGVPKSTNHIYKFFRSRMYMTPGGRALKRSYQSQAKKQLNLNKPISAPIAVKILLIFGDKRRRDIDNYNKILLDSLSGIAYEDDSQIQEISIRKIYQKDKPRIVIEIKEDEQRTF